MNRPRPFTNVLVTGSAGFIGSHFVDHLLKTDAAVTVVSLDALTYAGRREHLPPEGTPRHSFIHGDIRDQELVTRTIAENAIDLVVNFAAETHVDRSILGPAAFVETNVRGTFALLEAVREASKTGPIRFHQVSTDEVYGSLGAADAPWDEDAPFRPRSPYSASKAAGDLLVHAYVNTFGVFATRSHSSNNFGSRQHEEKFIPTMFRAFLGGNRAPLYGDGSNIRDWIHVEDHCEAIDRIVRGAPAGSVYNVGGSCEITNLDLAKRIARVVDRVNPANAPHERLIEFVADRPGHDFRYALDCRRIAHDLAFVPKRSIEQGLEELQAVALDRVAR